MKTFFSLTWVACVLLLAACSKSVVPSENVEGKKFPTVTAELLDGKTITLPEALQGKPALLLIGYEQRAQFDIDRWLLGLVQLETPVVVFEVPTIRGMLPRAAKEFINSGMRSGIPAEDWGIVATVYGDADKIVSALGNDRPQSATVVLLDASGTIVWSYNGGYSAKNMKELDAKIRQLD